MMAQVVLEEFEPDKGVADLTCCQALRTLRKDMSGKLIHGYELVAGKTLCAVMFIIHVLC